MMTEVGEDAVAASADRYTGDTEDARIARTAAILEGETYGRLTRVEEVLLFAQRMGYEKVGIASCVGLKHECAIFAKAAEARGVRTVAALCKIGGVDKCRIGLTEEQKVRPGRFEAMCNPILQAEALNRVGTDFNVVIGLCVGHDTLFIRHSAAPVTYLIVKDRVLCHNPAGALYTAESYYKRIVSE
jgi:uncharacterized metal-binding protein